MSALVLQKRVNLGTPRDGRLCAQTLHTQRSDSAGKAYCLLQWAALSEGYDQAAAVGVASSGRVYRCDRKGWDMGSLRLVGGSGRASAFADGHGGGIAIAKTLCTHLHKQFSACPIADTTGGLDGNPSLGGV